MGISKKSLRGVFIIIVVLLMIRPAWGQQADTTSRPQLGLVLSGGAAKGLAHIGVLKVMEEAGLYPDYITGTSMGAIIGGLYSLGYSADQLLELTQSTDWDKTLTDQVKLNKIVMEEKHDYKRFLVEFPIHEGEFNLPRGLNEGYQLGRVFSRLTWGATGIYEFDSLPIPFHCMAVDIIEGRPVEFDSGHLSRAIRASMAIPGVFAPVRMDSMLLVDGGVIRNFPVQEVIDMGADVVIGVYVGYDEDVKPDELYSLTDILTRTTVMMGVVDSKRQMEKVDVLIQPDVEGIQSYDFTRGRKIAGRGEEAARKAYEQFLSIADSLETEEAVKDTLAGPDYVYVSDIGVDNLQYVAASFVIGKGEIFPGTYVDQKRLDRAVERIFSTRYFKKVDYRLEKRGEEIYKLVYVVKETSRAQVKGALHYDNDLGAGLIVNGTVRNVLLPASRINLTLNLAEKPGVKFDAQKYFGKKQQLMDHYFVNWYRSKLPVFFEGERVGKYKHGMFKAGVGGKYSINLNQQVGIDGFYESSTIYPDEALQSFYPQVNFENYGFGGIALRAFYKLNNQDHLYFPTEGTRVHAYLKRVFKPISKYSIEGNQTLDEQIFSLSLEPFNAFYFNTDHYFRISKSFSFNLGTSLGLVSNGTPVTNHFALGGVMFDDKINYETLAGFQYGEQVMPNFWKINTGLDMRFNSRIFLTFKAGITHSANQVNNMYSSLLDAGWNDFLQGYAGGVRINSFLGPMVFMVGSNNTDSRARWYLNLGYTF